MKAKSEKKNVGIAKVKQLQNRLEIRRVIFELLDQLKARGKVQIPLKANVMIKPNICFVKGYETGATVDPYIVKCLVEWLLQNYDVQIITIGEADATELDVDIAFKVLGWEDMFKSLPNVRLLNLTKDEQIDVQLNGLCFKNLRMSRTYMEADFLISVAKLKTHVSCGTTIILKNQFGAIPIKNKIQYHRFLNEAIHDLNKLKTPNLCLVDGVIAMEGRGPIKGVPKPAGILIVGDDPVAVDHACAKIMGIGVDRIPHLKMAFKWKLGDITYDTFGQCIDETRLRFNLIPWWKRAILWIYQNRLIDRIFSKSFGLPTHSNGRGKKLRRISIGIVGLGTISNKIHIPVLTTMPEVRIDAAAEIDRRRGEKISKKWNIPKLYTDYDDMYKNSSLDAVFVCLPNSLHYQATRGALLNNLHVFCEKPMGLSSRDAYELARIAKRKDLALAVGYNKRFSKNYKLASKIVNGCRLGRITHIHAVSVQPGPYASWKPSSDWFFKEESGGVIFDSGSHLIDLVTYLLSDKITELSAKHINTLCGLNIFDNIVACFTTDKGTLGTLNIGWQAGTFHEAVQIHGTAGSLVVNPFELQEMSGSFNAFDRAINHIKFTRSSLGWAIRRMFSSKGPDETYFNQAQAFVHSLDLQKEGIKNSERNYATGDDGVRVLEVLEGLKEALRSQESVKIKYRDI